MGAVADQCPKKRISGHNNRAIVEITHKNVDKKILDSFLDKILEDIAYFSTLSFIFSFSFLI